MFKINQNTSLKNILFFIASKKIKDFNLKKLTIKNDRFCAAGM